MNLLQQIILSLLPLNYTYLTRVTLRNYFDTFYKVFLTTEDVEYEHRVHCLKNQLSLIRVQQLILNIHI